MSGPRLSLAELEAFDPQAPPAGADGERRFCCPLGGICADKPRDQAHRSLSVNIATGLWHCPRCKNGGQLTEHWTPRPTDRRARQRATLARAFSLPAPPPSTPYPGPRWAQRWAALPRVDGTPGAAYLARRGIPVDVATAAGARFVADFYGRPAVLFPITIQTGEVVAVTGRYIDGREDPKTRTYGRKSLGMFVTPGALAADPLVLVEAPLDALALATCGVPAVALCGTSGPRWLPQVAALHLVLLALDRDPAGEAGVAALVGPLTSLGARCERLRPQGKDWAEDLCTLRREGLTVALAAVGLGEAPSSVAALTAPLADTVLVEAVLQDTGAAEAPGDDGAGSSAFAASTDSDVGWCPVHRRRLLDYWEQRTGRCRGCVATAAAPEWPTGP
jgi:hypothetical protein